MSQDVKDKSKAAEVRTEETRGFIREVRRAARRKYSPEEKIRIVLEGFRREATVRDLCRREAIKPGAFYAWTKDFMEAGKERLTRDTIRDATRQEIEQIKRENAELKHLVADLSPGSVPAQKNSYSATGGPRWRQRMSAGEKAAVLARVETLAGHKRRALAELGIPRSTCYRWRQGQRCQGLDPHSGDGRRPWNRLTPEEDGKILAAARKAPELSSRQLAAWITDNAALPSPSPRCTASCEGRGW